ncbi:stage III sporulation protein AF [Gordoniibacillus kamchatkensis]|uniref:stage III sporulation protein AF n=1 Tax=Gordoniibacillus kamchatkensis TaxID=1590651 RepID=UPI0006975FEE|nr:stage III sporulation protein AF [Paenibacillus sp. VKM B-2647]
MLGMSVWLKTVITVIMLATFVDLLLPNSAMQRYVRTVMSLFVLLTLLSPLIQLFQRSWQPEKLFALVGDQEARMAAAAQAGGAMPSLEAIQRQAEQLKAVNAQQEKRLVETQLAAQIKDRLQGETELPITAVQVTTGTDKRDKPYIENVRVTLGPPQPPAAAVGDSAKPDASSGGTAGQIGKPLAIEIKPVDPVRIRIGSGSDDHTSAAAAPAGGVLPAPYRQDQTAVSRVLVKEYQLSPDRVHVLYSGDAHAS